MSQSVENDAPRLRRIHHKSCLLYDYDPRLTKGLNEDRDCRCPAPYDCGHFSVTRGCGGCDPGAIEFVRNDGGPWVRVLPPANPEPGDLDG